MKTLSKILSMLILIVVFGCNNDDDNSIELPINTEVNFQFANSINIGGVASAEITAFDPLTNKVFIVNND